jgi:Na+-translocating ferredoxin:NAD+ oxidoreductase subunit C
MGVSIEAFPFSEQNVYEGKPIYPEDASAEEILTAIQNAGIVGLGEQPSLPM